MDAETTQNNDTTRSETLCMALELSSREWRLGFSIGLGQAPRLRRIAAGDLKGLMAEIQLAKNRFRLLVDGAVRRCYEAG